LPQSCLCDTHQAGDEPLAQTSVRTLDKTMDLLVSEADVTIVTDGIIRTTFQKLYSAAIIGRNAIEDSITLSPFYQIPLLLNTNRRKSSA
jgi:hypothetical protein